MSKEGDDKNERGKGARQRANPLADDQNNVFETPQEGNSQPAFTTDTKKESQTCRTDS